MTHPGFQALTESDSNILKLTIPKCAQMRRYLNSLKDSSDRATVFVNRKDDKDQSWRSHERSLEAERGQSLRIISHTEVGDTTQQSWWQLWNWLSHWRWRRCSRWQWHLWDGCHINSQLAEAGPHAYLGRHRCFHCQRLTTHACRYNRLPIRMETMIIIKMEMMIEIMKLLLHSSILAVTRLNVAKCWPLPSALRLLPNFFWHFLDE